MARAQGSGNTGRREETRCVSAGRRLCSLCLSVDPPELWTPRIWYFSVLMNCLVFHVPLLPPHTSHLTHFSPLLDPGLDPLYILSGLFFPLGLLAILSPSYFLLPLAFFFAP